MERRWKKIRYRLEWLCCRLLASMIPLLPRRSCVTLANFVGVLAYRLDGRGRAVALANIEAAFGDLYDEAGRRRIARASYCNFTRTMFDLFWSPRLRAADHERYLTLEGAEVLARLRAEGRGAVLMCVHQDNFEWASLACGFHGYPTMIVTENFKNPLLASIFRALREGSSHQIIEQESSMIRLLRQVKRGGFAGMLVDLNLPPTQAAVVIETFGMKTCVTMLHAVLAQRGGAALVPLDSRPFPDGTCRAVLHPPIELPKGASLQEIAQTCWDFFEPWVRKDPASWMWAYKHWRYKPADAVRSYPFYANTSSKFEKLMRSMDSTKPAKHLTKRAI